MLVVVAQRTDRPLPEWLKFSDRNQAGRAATAAAAATNDTPQPDGAGSRRRMAIDAELARLTAVSKEEAGDGTLMPAAELADDSTYNHTDPKRQELIKKYNPSGAHTYGTEPNRLEIMLSLASVQHYASWVRRVYIVVPPGQGDGLPLRLLAPSLRAKVQVVEESEFIPARFLPTFSSIVVESFLHAIPGIAEHFLYMMDDVLFGMPFSRELAFSSTPGIGNVFLMDWPWMAEKPRSYSPDDWGVLWSWPFYNTGELLRQTFGEKPARLGWHAGYMLTKTAYRVAWALYGEELNRTAQHKFRVYKPWDKGGDIVAHLLVQHTALRLGLQKLVKSVEVPWRSDRMGDPTSRLPPGVPRDKLATYGNPDCSHLKGLPKDMLQKGPGTIGVTFANFNKIQNTEEWSWRRLCREALEVIADGFAPEYVEKGCLCSSSAVGEKC
ncbi:hypothetical protein ABPG77_003963 [Micractinium sp. CCAP 211/92]